MIMELKITERALLSGLFTLLVFLIFGKNFINFLRKIGLGQKVSKWGPETHFKKEGTPTGGGVFIASIVSISTIFFGNLDSKFLTLSLLCLILYSILGIADDVLKKKSVKRGFTISQKLFLQILFAIIIMFLTEIFIKPYSIIFFPFSGSIIEIPRWLFFIFSVLVIVGASNAVNLTDGLDGLAASHLLIAFSISMILTYLAGHYVFAKYLEIPFVSGVGEVSVLCSAILGALLGFLWFNSFPAEVFMGDSGSLPLGALLGYISIISKTELFLPIFGGIFVIEAVSVLIQIFSFKITKKRVFKMAPLHHHFELMGWSEPKVTVRFTIISIILGIISLIGIRLKI